MTPADRIHDNGDGTMWWVSRGPGLRDSHFSSRRFLSDFDRPCDTCDDVRPRCGEHPNDDALTGCRGTGRHVWPIVVEDIRWMGAHTTGTRRLLVHVVPDMVLPIVDNDAPEWAERHDHHVGMGIDEIAVYDGYMVERHEPQWVTDISLPPAAKPGMWAVQLRKVDQ